MSNPIKPRRSWTPNAVPTTSDVASNELAINWADGILYTKDPSGAIVSLQAGGGGSSADTALRAFFVPPAPTNVAASAGNAQATVTWTAPTVLAQTPITDYVVQYSSDSGSTWTTFSDGTSTTASATVTGLTNGTAYTFRVAAVNGVGTGSYSTASSAVTPQAGDSLFGNVSLLLHADGSGSSFVDSSAYGRTITASGDATQSATQYKWGGKSAHFDGSGDYLQVANNAAFNFGSGDWTVEFWLYASAQGLSPIAHQCSYSGQTGWVIWNYDNVSASNATRKLTLMLNGANYILTSSSDCYSDNTWQHIAVCRSGNTINMYAGGTRVATDTFSGSINDASTPFQVGGILGSVSWNGSTYFNGYIDDLRVTKGTARYTGSTIAVPTSAFPEAVPGTDPLFSSVSLLLHADGSGNTFTDSSAYSRTVTAYGDATQSATQSKWGGKSLSLDGSGDYLTADIGAIGNTFTVEAWVYLTALPGGTNAAWLTDFRTGNGNNYTLGVYGGSGVPYFYANGSAYSGSTGITTNAWHHLAFVNDAGSFSVYVDGVQCGTATMSYSQGSATAVIGARNSQNSEYLAGYVDDLRISTVARYSGSSFTVPTSAFPEAVPGTDPLFSSVSLLLHADGSGSSFVDSSAYGRTITVSGNVTQSSTQSKFGGKSAAFDGSSYLSASISSDFEFGTDDFCVEGWVFPTSYTNSRIIGIGNGANGGGPYTGWTVRLDTTGIVSLYRYDGSTETEVQASNAVSLNAWSHVAVARQSGTVRIYINGSLSNSGSFSASLNKLNNDDLQIGRVQFGTGAIYFNGYIDDLRVTKGSNRGYAGSTIAVPTAAFPDA